MKTPRTYPGKTAPWLYAIVIAWQLVPVWMLVQSDNFWTVSNIIVGLIIYGCDAFWLPIIIRNRVDVYDHFIEIKYGYGTLRLEIPAITCIQRTHSVLAASANSLDRIRIETQGEEVVLSLQDNEGFIELIKTLQNQETRPSKQ